MLKGFLPSQKINKNLKNNKTKQRASSYTNTSVNTHKEFKKKKIRKCLSFGVFGDSHHHNNNNNNSHHHHKDSSHHRVITIVNNRTP